MYTNPFQYSGRESDTETGLYYYRARYYDPGTGRFLSEDPLRSDAGDLNFFNYVGDSPTNATDPMGLCKVLVRFTKVWGWVPVYHAYIVTVDPSGQMTGFRGGPGGPGGSIKTTNNVPYDKYFPDYESGPPPKGLCQTVLDDNKPCLKINLKLAAAFNRIDSAEIPYTSLTNSNSVVPYALGQAGLPVPALPKFAPGWYTDPFPTNSLPHNQLDGIPSP